jgi:hypothetical protein
MHPTLATNLQLRKMLLNVINHFTLDELNHIPEGFNNNIFWNAGHIVATQQLLVYSLAGARWSVDKDLIKTFKNGTKPERPYTQEDLDALKGHLTESIKRTQADFEAGAFATYTSYTTETRFTVDDFDSAATFNIYHEGLHMGYILSMQKFV